MPQYLKGPEILSKYASECDLAEAPRVGGIAGKTCVGTRLYSDLGVGSAANPAISYWQKHSPIRGAVRSALFKLQLRSCGASSLRVDAQ
jgi:hypothetical protein